MFGACQNPRVAWRMWVGSAVTLTLLTGVPRDAVACSFAVLAIQSSYPVQDDQDVPTNAVLFADGPELAASHLSLATADGEEVPVHVTPVEPSGFDLFPVEELGPNRTYSLRGRGPVHSHDITFTTGPGPVEPTANLSLPELRLVQKVSSIDTCGELGALCPGVALAPGAFLEIRFETELLSLQRPVSFYRPYSQVLPDGACVTVRARDVLGNRSPSTTLCISETVVTEEHACEAMVPTFPPGEGGAGGMPESPPRNCRRIRRLRDSPCRLEPCAARPRLRHSLRARPTTPRMSDEQSAKPVAEMPDTNRAILPGPAVPRKSRVFWSDSDGSRRRAHRALVRPLRAPPP
jgi:hypothetical protein